MNIPAPRTQYIWGLKGDVQFSPKNRLSLRGNGYDQEFLSGGGATAHPSTALDEPAVHQAGAGRLDDRAEQPHGQRRQGRL